MIFPSKIEISKSALKNNIRFIRDKIGKQVRLCSVIKGNAYGHGIHSFLPVAEGAGINCFGVFSAEEALYADQVRKPDTEIMIMGMIDNPELEWAIERNISFYVFELDRLQAAVEFAKRLGKPARIHVEFETGMNRTGFHNRELEELCSVLNKESEHIQIEGFCTHYAGAESISNYLRIKNQIHNFHNMAETMNKHGVHARFNHTACSAPMLNYPDTIMDMVRIGILQYGFWPSKETYMQYMLKGDGKNKDNPLRRVIKWKSQVMSVKSVAAGEFVNYGTMYQAGRDMRIATVPVGYCHGFSRSLSNLGRVLIHGKRVPVVGVVNMNMIVVDITSLDGVVKGDEVIIVGKQGNNSITLGSFAEMTNKLNYESLVRIPHDLPREVVP